MTQVTLIQCTNSKRDKKAPARYLYDESAYFRRMREWAKAMPGEWAIISAKHGFVHPNQELEPYDDRGLSKKLSAVVADTIDDLGFDHVDVTAGMDYTNHLVPELEKRGIDVVNHFTGKRIGERRELLKHATSELKNESLC